MAFCRIISRLRALFGKISMDAGSTKSLPPHLELGKRGEEFAARYLRKCGYSIIARNWRHGPLELDIIGRDAESIVFVEVKTRQNTDFGGPEAGITEAKKRRLIKCALFWLQQHGAWNIPARFDVLCLTACGKTFHLEHYRNAFDFSSPVDNRHSTWQPW